MNTDFRLSVDYLDHPKIIKLIRRLGDAGMKAHLRLLAFAAKWRGDGCLIGMDHEEIAIAANWDGDADHLIDTLIDLRLLDVIEDGYAIHDWEEHNPFAVGHKQRSETARQAARKRWDRRAGGSQADAECNADGNAKRNAKRDANSNAERNADGNPRSVSDRSDPIRTDPERDMRVGAHAREVSPSLPPDTGADLLPETEPLCQLLADLIEANGSKRPAVTVHWIDQMELLLTADNRSPSDVETMIRFAQSDDFWCATVMTPKALRKHWDTIRLQRDRPKVSSRASPGKPSKPVMGVTDDAIERFLKRHEGGDTDDGAGMGAVRPGA